MSQHWLLALPPWVRLVEKIGQLLAPQFGLKGIASERIVPLPIGYTLQRD